jgi:predicted regulator of Ras-like GTPase activity (Roadblock/LC7/MglB family)
LASVNTDMQTYGMEKMTDHKNIYAALAAAQMQMGKAVKDSTNLGFKSKYADLASVMDACMGALNANGIAVYQPTVDDEGGRYVKTIFAHISGETLECRVPLIIQKNDMQGYGSAVTYARRYGLMGMAGIAPEDDDGNAAAKAAPRGDVVEPARRVHINAEQFVAMSAELDRTGSDEARLAAWLGAKSLEELNVDQWERAMAAMKKKPSAEKQAV